MQTTELAERLLLLSAHRCGRKGRPKGALGKHRRFDAEERGARDAYRRQKHRAEQRKIEWRFTFETWFAVWQRSGKLAERGRASAAYVMGRFGDCGPYSPDNVEIITCSQNVKDAAVRRRAAVLSELSETTARP